MIHQQIVFERIRMIEICDLTIVEWKVFEIAVIGVLLNKNYFAGANRFEDAICNSCLSRSRTTGNADYHAYVSSPNCLPRLLQPLCGVRQSKATQNPGSYTLLLTRPTTRLSN